MNFTTTTEIARKWSKIFELYDEAIVLSNNKPIGALMNYKMYQYCKKMWYFDEAIESFQNSQCSYYQGLQNNLKDWAKEDNDNLFV